MISIQITSLIIGMILGGFVTFSVLVIIAFSNVMKKEVNSNDNRTSN